MMYHHHCHHYLVGIPELDVAGDVCRHQARICLRQQLSQDVPTHNVQTWNYSTLEAATNDGRTDFKRLKDGQTLYYNRFRLTFLKLVGGVGDTGLQERLLHGVRALLEHHVDHLPDNRLVTVQERCTEQVKKCTMSCTEPVIKCTMTCTEQVYRTGFTSCWPLGRSWGRHRTRRSRRRRRRGQ